MAETKDWHLINAKPMVYALGNLTDNIVKNIDATVERLDDGAWRWRLLIWRLQGIEPNKEIAKQVAEKQLAAMKESNLYPPDY